jgi:type II secretory pathway predicted ATPase ExeA
MAADIDEAESVVDIAVGRIAAERVVRLSATTDHLSELVKAVFDTGPPDVGGERVVVVVSDADLASVTRLERLRVQLESMLRNGDGLRLVLVGTRVLQRILDLPSARALASRIGLRLVVGQKRGIFRRLS